MCGHNLYAVFVAETRWERSSKKKNARCLQKNDQYCRVAEDPRNLKTNGRQVCAHHRGRFALSAAVTPSEGGLTHGCEIRDGGESHHPQGIYARDSM